MEDAHISTAPQHRWTETQPPPRNVMLPVKVPHQDQAVLAPRKEVTAVVGKAEAREVLVVSVQDGEEVPAGDLESKRK